MKRKLLLFFLAFGIIYSGISQERKITGKVTSHADGVGIPGVTVKVSGTSNATQTDVEGNYSIAANIGSEISFTAVGYEAQNRLVANANIINVSLSESLSQLDEVMIVAYGTAKKSNFTGSAANINQESFKDAPTNSFEQAIVGRIPGVQINTTSGQAGSTSTIRVRGVGSMNATKEPLYVIDGVPVVSGDIGQMGGQLYTSNNIMSTISPSDIESITILKDAAASALYGSRAANGVVIINTKKGKSGAARINLRTSIGFTPEWATENYRPGDPQQQIQYFYRIFHDYRTSNGQTDEQANAYALNRMATRFGIHGYDFSTDGVGLDAKVTITGKTDGVENRDGKYFDWNNALFRTGVYQTNDLSFSAGSDKTKVYASLSYTKDKGRAYTNDFQRIGGRVNINQKVMNFIDFGANINISHTDKSGYNDTRNTGTNYMFLANNLLFPFYWPTDYKTGEPYTTRYRSLGYNPLYYDTQWNNSSKILRIIAAPSLTVNFLPNLVGKTIFSFDNSEAKDHLYYSPLHYNTTYGVTANGTVFEYSTNIMKLVSSSTLNYFKNFGQHNLDLLVGFEAEKNKTNYQYASGSNLPSSSLHTVATAGVKDASAYFWGNTIMSVLSKAEYNFDERFFASASFRRDGSSRLGPDTRWGNFWSVSGAWNLKKEGFLSEVSMIDNLRLKASYGTNGTLPSSNFGWRSLASYGSNYSGEPGGAITTVADANLKWEKSYTTNVGIDFGILKNRLRGSVEYFNRDSKDLLQDVNISLVTGFTSTLKNIGSINNRGLEVAIDGDILLKSNFRWTAGFNASIINSKVVELYDGQDIIWSDPTGRDARVTFIYREGEKVYSYYLAEWAGVDPSNGAPIWYTNDGTEGDFLYNGRGASNSFSDAQQIIAGSPLPKAYGGINTDFEYKGISLAFNFIYKWGGKLFDAGSRDVAEDGYYWERIRSYYGIEDAWAPWNTGGIYPNVSGNDPVDGISRSTRHLYDASFLRLKNVTLAYKFPNAIVNRIGLSNARVFFNGMNLMTLAKFKFADPEVNEYGSRGWETPFGKTYSFGLELGL